MSENIINYPVNLVYFNLMLWIALGLLCGYLAATFMSVFTSRKTISLSTLIRWAIVGCVCICVIAVCIIAMVSTQTDYQQITISGVKNQPTSYLAAQHSNGAITGLSREFEYNGVKMTIFTDNADIIRQHTIDPTKILANITLSRPVLSAKLNLIFYDSRCEFYISP